jgi:hypothetical protein
LVLVLTTIFGGVGVVAYRLWATEDKAKNPATDKERLQGTWTEVAVERAGKREKKEQEHAKQLVFDGDKLLIKEKGAWFIVYGGRVTTGEHRFGSNQLPFMDLWRFDSRSSVTLP